MAEALILDSEAINALANPTQRGAPALRARAIARVAYERGALVRIPAPVLAEVSRGGRLDAPINHFLNRDVARVVDLTRPIAQRSGALLAAARMSSAHAVDAFVVSTALEFEHALIATGDPKDIKRLAPTIRRSLSWSFERRASQQAVAGRRPHVIVTCDLQSLARGEVPRARSSPPVTSRFADAAAA